MARYCRCLFLFFIMNLIIPLLLALLHPQTQSQNFKLYFQKLRNTNNQPARNDPNYNRFPSYIMPTKDTTQHRTAPQAFKVQQAKRVPQIYSNNQILYDPRVQQNQHMVNVQQTQYQPHVQHQTPRVYLPHVQHKTFVQHEQHVSEVPSSHVTEAPRQPTKPENEVHRDSSCSVQPLRGACLAAITRYHYNSALNQCDCFNYGGCGPMTGYSRMSECLSKCRPLNRDEGPVCKKTFILTLPPRLLPSRERNLSAQELFDYLISTQK